jgi:patatin-related protein
VTTKPARELRIGLVCYGGVSLAIYMHGVTKELHKLVSASRAFDDDVPNPFRPDDTRHAYYLALEDLARDGQRVSVSIDVIAGTSAGGINGVCLAKVIAGNGTQEALKSLWINEADFTTLLRAKPAIGGWKLRAVLAGLRLVRHLEDADSPLKGEVMSKLVYSALRKMDTREKPDDARPTLLRKGATIDLYVTTTDLYGENVVVPTGVGGASQRETDHAQVLWFRSSHDEFRDAAPLAFAARATSCFPGAFQPVSRTTFRDEVGDDTIDIDAIARRFRNRYGKKPVGEGYASDDAWFADGGILDNAPFDLVIRAIAEKRAETEVVRRLVYIQPDPGAPLGTGAAADAAPRAEPGYLKGVALGAVSVRGSHSILRELLTLRELNLKIDEIGSIAEAQQKRVERRLGSLWPSSSAKWKIDDPAAVKALADAIYRDAEGWVGAGYQAYVSLKVQAAARRIADVVTEHFAYPPDSGHASLLRATFGEWARRRTLDKKLTDKQSLALLGPVDVPYKERRLMFVLAGINGLYARLDEPGAPPRDDLDALKGWAWRLLSDLRQAARDAVEEAPALLEFLALAESDVFAAPEEFAAKHDDAFAALYRSCKAFLDARLVGANDSMWRAFSEITPRWRKEYRVALLSRFLGFPLWDSLIFPTITLADLPQFTPIEVSQFSPVAALAVDVGVPKLDGVALHHFGAFADPAARENDYLWGRLDGAELVLRTLRATATSDRTVPTTPEQARAAAGKRLRGALDAVLASEQDLKRVKRMTKIREAVQKVSTQP